MKRNRKLVSFDWAIKRLLRSKTNFKVLEGFLSELLGQDIAIQEILESESTPETRKDKVNRVDIKVKRCTGEILLIEIQFDSEYDYLHRILFGTSKAITEHMHKGMSYEEVKKIISINILYFDLGMGQDYVYHGTTRFIGLHEKDELKLSYQQREYFKKEEAFHIFPEYYLLKVNQFNDLAKNGLDEWVYFLKHSEIPGHFTAKGLDEAQEAMDVMNLSDEERRAYEQYEEDLHYFASMASTYKIDLHYAHKEGLEQGIEEGIEKGIEKGAIENARQNIFILLESKHRDLPQTLVQKIETMADRSVLERLFRLVLDTNSMEDIEAWLDENNRF